VKYYFFENIDSSQELHVLYPEFIRLTNHLQESGINQ